MSNGSTDMSERPAYDWQITVTYSLDLPHELAEEAAGQRFERVGEDDDSFEYALEKAAKKALADPGSWICQMVANTEPDVEVS